MNKLSKYILSGLALLLPLSLLARQDSLKTIPERKTSIMLSMANFSIAGLTEFNPWMGHPDLNYYIADQFGISVEHKLAKNIFLGISYNEWNINHKLHKIDYDIDSWGFHDQNPLYTIGGKNIDSIGALRYRYGYKMYDINCSYRFDKLSHHRFTGGIGISYAQGTNFYVRSKYFDYNANFEIYKMEEKYQHYFGLILPIRYDLLFLKQHVGIGVQSNFRKYFGLYSWQIDYGLHLSVNF